MTWKFGNFLLFLFERLLWSRNYLFVYFLRCCDLANLLVLHADTKPFYCMYVHTDGQLRIENYDIQLNNSETMATY